MTTRALVPAAAVAAAALAVTIASPAGAAPNLSLSGVAANPRIAGVSSTNNLTPEWAEHPVATGAAPLENPQDWAAYYGYDNDGPLTPAPGTNIEASKTEPDKNTYLVKAGLRGADATYDYGTHFVYQGHETGINGYITRINLDADAAHRVTLIATRDVTGALLPVFDGSAWDPFTGTLLFSAEKGNAGGIWEGGPDIGAAVTDVSGIFGRGGYEGIQIDSAGQVWVVEDVGGAAAGANGKGKQPNSFVYRLVPNDPTDLSAGGKLQALTILGPNNQPISINADSPLETQLHTYGVSFRTRWTTIHDTGTAGFAPFDANALAKAAHATPFKRPENGQFQPGDGFRDFFFTETGDTNATSPYNADHGGWGGILHLAQRTPTDNTGHLSLLYYGNQEHTGLDNLSFLNGRQLLVVEDAGDTLHTQRNALDSGFVLDVKHDYSDGPVPVRWLGEGRDPSATIDVGLAGTPGFQNEGDNEITGIHVSNGDPTVAGLIGTDVPTPFENGWRIFWTQQHGDNVTYEVTPS